MMKILYNTNLLVLFLLFVDFSMFCQSKVTFQVEELSRPDNSLPMTTSENVYKNLILMNSNLSISEGNRSDPNISFSIIAKSDTQDSLVFASYHPFFNGMYSAYADHRPFVLSPDIIWLLISQGFACHVNANPEKLRESFVDFSGRISLIVSDTISLNSKKTEWENIFPKFTEQIAEYTNHALIDILRANFSTTTSVEKLATQITIMEAMKPYFEFVYIYAVCGIPEITLEGTTEDWEKVLEKTKLLSKYNLEWWTKELEPLLKEFIKASKGDVNKRFWRNMFKYHSGKKYGSPKEIDGWIVKFFPYDKYGKRNNLQKLIKPIGENYLPEEIVKVDFKYQENNSDGSSTKIPLELWAGFIGLHQDMDTYALKPVIGWMIRKKDVYDTIKFESDDIHIRVREIPESILKLKNIKHLQIDFIDEILIPQEMSNINIEFLTLSGKIDNNNIDRIKRMFPNTQVKILHR